MAGTGHRNSDSSESETPLPRPLGKRKRYTPLACDVCKRRKVKCDGQTPCQRCARDPKACVYASRVINMPSRQEKEYKTLTDKIENLQHQIDSIISTTSLALPPSNEHPSLTTPMSTLLPVQSTQFLEPNQPEINRDVLAERDSAYARQPQFMGPTSSSFLFKVATRSLEQAGIHTNVSSAPGAEGHTVAATASIHQTIPDVCRAVNPLRNVSRHEAFRLIDLYEEECGSEYPFIEKTLVYNAAQNHYDRTRTSGPSSLAGTAKDENTLSDGIWDISKLVIAVASVIENQGPTDLSSELLESVESGFHARFCGPSVDILEIQAWTAMSILQFHCDEEVLAWRTIGLAGRAAIELGLHRCESYSAKFPNTQQRSWANRLFWCIYVLDRRWSFGTGRSFAIPDHDIDPDLPQPSASDSHLLSVMVMYAHLGSKVWKATTKATTRATTEKLSFLDFLVRQWQSSIIPQFQLQPINDKMLEGRSRFENRIRVLLYLRANQMRLHLFGRTLLSSKTINDDLSNANRAVDTAKDNIRVLNLVNRTADIYSAQQPAFNYFLVSSLAVLFVAVCHAPSHFIEFCREEFFMALELIRGFSSKSYIGKKLWKKINHLKIIGPRLGILPNERQDTMHQNRSRPNNTSQVYPRSTHDTWRPDQNSVLTQSTYPAFTLTPFDDRLDPHELSNELTTLFETVQPINREGLVGNTESETFDVYDHETTEDFSRSFLTLF